MVDRSWFIAGSLNQWNQRN